uniref:Uncharacterized protein n=1 Tax=Timema shepardi TaxID=629360 RepID=A0A7R9ASC6_TIMSH|nr:unnamed protein product [Timema shepardi]
MNLICRFRQDYKSEHLKVQRRFLITWYEQCGLIPILVILTGLRVGLVKWWRQTVLVCHPPSDRATSQNVCNCTTLRSFVSGEGGGVRLEGPRSSAVGNGFVEVFRVTPWPCGRRNAFLSPVSHIVFFPFILTVVCTQNVNTRNIVNLVSSNIHVSSTAIVLNMSSVKVAVRVRPFNNREISRECKCIIEMEDKTTLSDSMGGRHSGVTNDVAETIIFTEKLVAQRAFQYKGWSNVIIGGAWWFISRLQMKSIVDKMQDLSSEYKSVIGMLVLDLRFWIVQAYCASLLVHSGTVVVFEAQNENYCYKSDCKHSQRCAVVCTYIPIVCCIRYQEMTQKVPDKQEIVDKLGIAKTRRVLTNYSSPMASLVLTDSSQLTFDIQNVVHPIEIRTSISPSLQLNSTSALASYATERAGIEKDNWGPRKRKFSQGPSRGGSQRVPWHVNASLLMRN